MPWSASLNLMLLIMLFEKIIQYSWTGVLAEHNADACRFDSRIFQRSIRKIPAQNQESK